MDSVVARSLFDAMKASGLYETVHLEQVEHIFRTHPGDSQKIAELLKQDQLVTEYQFRKIRAGRTSDLVFGPYLILDKIGEGGMGKVYRAVQGRVGRIVALKTIRPHLMANKLILKRYQREAKAAARLDHPNIVSLYDADEINGRYFLAMEYVEGLDLSRIVKQFGHPPNRGLDDVQEICEYIRQAALGLDSAHRNGFVHRDIKPSNMLVSGERPLSGTNGEAILKILDMGLIRSTFDQDDDQTQSELTRDGTVVGTPDYMAPEQAKNSSTVDHRADLYSLGCTLFFLIRGQAPFPEGSPIDKLIRHQLNEPPDLRKHRPDLPESLLAILDKLMAKKPDDRFQSAMELAHAITPYSACREKLPSEVIHYSPVSLEPDPPSTIDSGAIDYQQQSERTPWEYQSSPPSLTPPETEKQRSKSKPSGTTSTRSAHKSTAVNAKERPPQNKTSNGTSPPAVRVRAVESDSKQDQVVDAEIVDAEVVESSKPSSTKPVTTSGGSRSQGQKPKRSRRQLARKQRAQKGKVDWEAWYLLGGLMFAGLLIVLLLIILRPDRSRSNSDKVEKQEPKAQLIGPQDRLFAA